MLKQLLNTGRSVSIARMVQAGRIFRTNPDLSVPVQAQPRGTSGLKPSAQQQLYAGLEACSPWLEFHSRRVSFKLSQDVISNGI
jgi:hypothetical protein